MIKRKFLIIISSVVVCAGAFSAPALGFVMESANYRMQRDSINFAGSRGESDSYSLEDTLGEIGTGESTSTNYSLNAGYQQNDEYINITCPDSVVLSPNIGGVSGGTADGDANIVVTTNLPVGYVLLVRATSSPAMTSVGENIADYTPGSVVPDFDWSISQTVSEFGFSPEGSDIVTRFRDDGNDCNAGTGDTPGKCWDKFNTTDASVSQASGANEPSGTATSLKLRAESGSVHLQPAGAYRATIVATAIANL